MKSRRVSAAGAASTLALVGALVGYSLRIAPRWLHVRRLRIGLIGLPEEWRGTRIVHLSDFHLGHKAVPKDLLRRARGEALAFGPDIIALTGDFFNDGRATERAALFVNWPLANVFAVLGNHDHRGGPAHVASLERDLRAGGVTVLSNDATSVELHGRTAWIVGVDDPYTGRDNILAALDGLPAGAEALLLLAHAPTVVDMMPVGRIRLALCGHTHGGQLRLLPSGRTPFLRVILWLIGEPLRNEPSIYHGTHWVRGAVVCVSNGLGLSQLPLRFRTRPQVVLIELCDASDVSLGCDDVRRYVDDRTPEKWFSRWLA
ncbi:MAG TPA: metallophosphoesterase [Thermomicrobiales bacterium]|nr:metallophosphoesterase [Thermomicrobiales bacterium]